MYFICTAANVVAFRQLIVSSPFRNACNKEDVCLTPDMQVLDII